MKGTLLAIGLALAMTTSIQAKTPKEVLEPYKAYRAALAEEKKGEAAEFAYDAWQNAEVFLGDSRMTGDLASNFADIAPIQLRGADARKDVSRAYERSIELAHLVPTVGDEIEIQRRIDFLSWGYARKKRDWPSKTFGLEALSSQLNQFGFDGTTYEADYLSLKAQRFYRGRKWKNTIDTSRKAIAAYANVEDALPSNLQFVVPVFLAQAFSEKKMPIESALVYQDLIDQLAQQSDKDFRINPVTAAQWLEQRDEALASGIEDARLTQIKEYTLPIDQSVVRPIISRQPMVPASFRRGSKSGKVKFKFSIDENGYVKAPSIIESTHKILHPDAIKALEGVRFAPNLPIEKRDSLDYNVTFVLLTETRKPLPFGDMKPRAQ
ncbi:MAG: energy transducer TonB [Litorimonas sp.]